MQVEEPRVPGWGLQLRWASLGTGRRQEHKFTPGSLAGVDVAGAQHGGIASCFLKGEPSRLLTETKEEELEGWRES